VAEWLNAAVLKTVVGETQPGVRIPPPPPLSPDADAARRHGRCLPTPYITGAVLVGASVQNVDWDEL
jgi:hypothetical protein